MSDETTNASPLSERPATAPTLRCPSCGAPTGNEKRACAHCGSLLATRRCPACFALNARESLRCGRCGRGLPAERAAAPSASPAACPDCRQDLVGRVFEAIEYAECARCGGLFLSSRVFDSVTRDADLRAHVHGLERVEAGTPATGKLPPVRYRKCPGCHTLMNRVNFAGVSRIVIDVCRKDGVWFDRGELTGIVEFLEDGGFEKSRSLDREKLRLEISELESRKAPGGISGVSFGAEDDGTSVLRRVAGFLLSLI